jgi:glycosyltransferase involved in cell wall biosynthesis
VIPLYNHARYIEAAIRSVLAQTRLSDEIILIDDGSSDGGFEIASGVLNGCPSASLARQSNSGAHATINRAVEAATADYIAVLNSDDVFEPGKLARCEQLIAADPQRELIIGKIRLIDAAGAEVIDGIMIEWLRRGHDFLNSTRMLSLSLLNVNFAVTTSNMVFTKKLWKRNAGFQPLRYCHDLEFLMAADRCRPLYYDCGQTHVAYRLHDENTIRQQPDRLYIELAAVIVSALLEKGSRVLSERLGADELWALHQVLRDRNMSGLMLLLAGIYGRYSDRSEFFGALVAPELYELYTRVLYPTVQT